MSKTSIIFGNGLSRALDNEYFQLKTAIAKVWNTDYCLDDESKSLIQSTLENKSLPSEENDLYNIHKLIYIVEFIKKFDIEEEKKWLKKEAYDLYPAYQKFIHQVARYFCTYSIENNSIWDNFIKSLVEFIKKDENVNIFTLNYDDILYQSLCKYKILDNYAYLIDGFLKTGFSKNNLNSNNNYYFHLHGSPLFLGNEKKKKYELDLSTDNHIVLSHFKHKEKIINSSYILRTYWEYMKLELNNSDTIILFGYGGNDIHLNKILYQLKDYKKKNIKIIEYENIDKIETEYNSEKQSKYFNEYQNEKFVNSYHCETPNDYSEVTQDFYNRGIDESEYSEWLSNKQNEYSPHEYLEYLYNSKEFKSKKNFWEIQLKRSFNNEDLILKTNILQFNNWDFKN